MPVIRQALALFNRHAVRKRRHSEQERYCETPSSSPTVKVMVHTAVADQFFHSLCAAARVERAGEDNCTQHPRGDHTPRPLPSNSVKSETYTGIEGCRKESHASNAGQFLQKLPVLAPSGSLETCYLFSHESPPVGWLPR